MVLQGAANDGRLVALVEDRSSGLPDDARGTLEVLVGTLAQLDAQIGKLNAEIARRVKKNDVARRLLTFPGIGPLIATAIAVLAPPPETFRRGRDFAAWLGLVPRQHSSGGKQKLGRTSKTRQRDIRHLLIIGAMSVVHWRSRANSQPGPWLARKSKILVAIALANKMARAVWATLARNEDYQVPKGAVS